MTTTATVDLTTDQHNQINFCRLLLIVKVSGDIIQPFVTRKAHSLCSFPHFIYHITYNQDKTSITFCWIYIIYYWDTQTFYKFRISWTKDIYDHSNPYKHICHMKNLLMSTQSCSNSRRCQKTKFIPFLAWCNQLHEDIGVSV